MQSNSEEKVNNYLLIWFKSSKARVNPISYTLIEWIELEINITKRQKLRANKRVHKAERKSYTEKVLQKKTEQVGKGGGF